MFLSNAYSKAIVYGTLIGNFIYNQEAFQILYDIVMKKLHNNAINAIELMNTINPIVILLLTMGVLFTEKFLLMWSTIEFPKERFQSICKPCSYFALCINMLCTVVFMNTFARMLQKITNYLHVFSSPMGASNTVNFSSSDLQVLLELNLTMLSVIALFMLNTKVLRRIAVQLKRED